MNSEEDGWRQFLRLCRRMKGEKELQALLEVLMTSTEREEMASRVRILTELAQRKKTQREMAKDLSVSIAKITRGSNALKSIKPEIRRLFEE